MRFRYVALGLLLSVSVVFAGSGPPPFTNGSPLATGVDGTYALIARGTNLTGIIEFTLSSGFQTADGVQGWEFFVDGQVLSGSAVVTISDGTVAGVLTGTGNSIPTNSDGSVTLPVAFIVSGNAGSGQFTGKLDQNSPYGLITGKGFITGAPPRIDQLVVIVNPSTSTSFIPPPAVTTTPLIIPGSTLPNTGFTVRGTRQTTTPLQAASPSPSGT